MYSSHSYNVGCEVFVSYEYGGEFCCISSLVRPARNKRFRCTTQLHHQGKALYNLWRLDSIITGCGLHGPGIESRWGEVLRIR